nr:Phage protein D [Klebsiella pneumoniae]
MNISSNLLDLNSKTPAFSIVNEGKNVTEVLDKRLMSLSLTDNRGFDADQLDLELDDADGQIVLPRRGAVITRRWAGKASHFSKGQFHSG